MWRLIIITIITFLILFYYHRCYKKMEKFRYDLSDDKYEQKISKDKVDKEDINYLSQTGELNSKYICSQGDNEGYMKTGYSCMSRNGLPGFLQINYPQ